MRYFFCIISIALMLSAASCGSKNSRGDAGQDTAVTEVNTVDEATAQQEVSKAADVITEREASASDDVVLTKIVNNGKPSVIDFSATWCGPCQMMKPIFHKLAAQYSDEYNFITIDIDENPELAEKYHIRAVPTFIFLDEDGEEADRIKGAVEESELRDMLQNPVWL